MARLALGLFGYYAVVDQTQLSGSYWYLSLMGRTILDLSEADLSGSDPVRIISSKLIGHTNVQVPKGTTVEIGGPTPARQDYPGGGEFRRGRAP